MAQYIMNMDRCMNPRPVTFLAPADNLFRGMFVEITGMAKNNTWLNGDDDFEAYQVQLAGAEAKKENLLINTSVPKQYDERLNERDFVNNEGDICRGHYITTGDEMTLPVDFVGGELTVGAEVELAGEGKLAVGSTSPIGEVVRVYNWNGQESVMIRFY